MVHGCAAPLEPSAGRLFSFPKHPFSLFFLVLLLFLSGSFCAHAATSLGTEEQRLRQQRDDRSRQERVEAPKIRLERDAAVPIPQELPDETPCFFIDDIQLRIPESITTSEPALNSLPSPGGQLHFLQRHLDPYRNSCIGGEGINLLTRQLTALLLERGYTTTRVAIPAQELATGTLQLTLIPGRVRALKVMDEALPLRTNALPVRPGQLLNIRDLEQGLEQMMRLPSQEVSFDLAPGDQPGESDIIIHISRGRPVRALLSLDDSGSDDTGRWRGGATLTIDGPLGLHDQLEVGWQDNANRHTRERQSEELRLRYTLPFGWWLAEVSASRYRYRQQITGINQSFTSSGETERIGGSITRTILRGQRQKLDVSLAVRHRESFSSIDDTEITVQRRDLTEAEVAVMERLDLGRARLNLKLAHSWGTPWFDAQDDFPDRLPGDPSFYYKVQTLDATLTTPLNLGPLQLRETLTFHGQYADGQLFASEQLAIGSRYTVRGFDGDRMLSAERGFYLRNDLDIPLARSGQTLFMGLDYGRVSGPSATYQPGRELLGCAIGLRGGWQGLSYEAFAGWALKKPAQLKTDQPAVGVSMSWMF